MPYTKSEVMEYINSEDVKFIRLAFCDVYGVQKNISIMPSELDRAFESGICIDGSAIRGFTSPGQSDLFLFPDPSSLSVLPWRPQHGKVVRMYCDIRTAGGEGYECDCRRVLKAAVASASEYGITCSFGAEFEFYLFKTDADGAPTKLPFDTASYMDIAPDDRGENVRRQICLTLKEMGITPECSHHEEGPGQNEIDFRHSEPLSAADNAMTFKTVIRTVASSNVLYADFSPKPLAESAGNGLHINISVKSYAGKDMRSAFAAGILTHIRELSAFLNPVPESFERLGRFKAPRYISYSEGNRSQLIRIPPEGGDRARIELRSPDPSCNPYIAYAVLIYAGLDGIKSGMKLPDPVDEDLTDRNVPELPVLPVCRSEAVECLRHGTFARGVLPEKLMEAYLVK